jgi:hypothetical protein
MIPWLETDPNLLLLVHAFSTWAMFGVICEYSKLPRNLFASNYLALDIYGPGTSAPLAHPRIFE